jgi:hypothetical protein
VVKFKEEKKTTRKVMNYGKNSIYIDVTEILLKVALSTINQTKQYIYIAVLDCRSYCFLDFNKNIY